MAYFIASFKEYEKMENKDIFTEIVRVSNDLPDNLKSDHRIKNWAFLAPYNKLQNDYLKGYRSEPEIMDEYFRYLEKIWPSYGFIFGCHGQNGQHVLMLCPEEDSKRYNLRTMLKFFMKSRGYPLTNYYSGASLN